LTDIRQRIQQDFLARIIEVDDAPLRRSVENAFINALAGASFGLHGFIEWGARQDPPNEDSDLDSMLRWSNDLLDPPRVAASPAIGDVIFTGTNSTVIPIGTELTNYDGQSFTTKDEYTISGTSVTGSVTASVAGADGNTAAASIVFLSTPIAGIDDRATVATGGLSGGADAEDKYGVLARLRERLKTPPRGGSTGDYVAWAKETAGVTRAWEFPNDPHTGWVTVVITDDNQTNLIPGVTTITNCQTNIDAKRPIMSAGAIVRGPTPQTIFLQWTDLIPNDTLTRASLEANVNQWILANGAPGAGFRQPDIENAAQSAPGVTSVTLWFPQTDPPVSDRFAMFNTISHSYL
jgi:uncharacterized phage protein gp47/JayE